MRFFAEFADPMEYAVKLTGHQLYRFRIGDYRVIFETEGNALFILAILKRDEAYRDL